MHGSFEPVGGIIAEVVAGFAGYYVVLAVWPNFYYGPVRHGIWAWLGLQAVCIAIYLLGVMHAHAGAPGELSR